MRNYELYFIVNPDLTSEETDKVIKRTEKLVKKELSVEELNVSEEGIKKLAYPIKKKWTGFYVSFTFEADEKNTSNIANIERALNIDDNVVRYLMVNLDHFNKLKSKEKLNETEIKSHRELNKGQKEKKCYVKYSGVSAIDYKNIEFLNQFTSPYAKIFAKSKTGTSSKYQRKVSKAIKRARHMALMPFTTKHYS